MKYYSESLVPRYTDNRGIQLQHFIALKLAHLTKSISVQQLISPILIAVRSMALQILGDPPSLAN
jgi:hypothetical protein